MLIWVLKTRVGEDNQFLLSETSWSLAEEGEKSPSREMHDNLSLDEMFEKQIRDSLQSLNKSII